MPVQMRVVLLATLVLMSCLSNSNIEEKELRSMSHETSEHQQNLWFAGSVEQAFAKAQQENRLVFLYWGAVWCPPCNEIKSQVFSQPRFAELMRDKVAVYLDGDSERAQIWAEKFAARGYPTILVLDGQGEERLRLSGAVDMSEFEAAMQSLSVQGARLSTLLLKTPVSSFTHADWQRLAYLSWDQLPESEYPPVVLYNRLQSMLADIPESLVPEKALLEAQLIAWTARYQQMTPALLTQKEALSETQVRARLLPLLGDQERRFAIRQFIATEAENVLTWLAKALKANERDDLQQAWLGAAAAIQQDPRLTSVDQKLWLHYPALVVARLNSSADQPHSSQLVDYIERAVAQADREARSDYQRHSVISGAAYLLRQVGSYEKARALLLKELQQTSTPWYYYSSLANLELDLDRKQQALMFANKARETAQGRASRIQWTASDLLLNLELHAADTPISSEVLAKSQNFFELVFEQPDGFAGRNQRRLQAVKKAFKKVSDQKQVQDFWRLWQRRCIEVASDQRPRCEDYFSS